MAPGSGLQEENFMGGGVCYVAFSISMAVVGFWNKRTVFGHMFAHLSLGIVTFGHEHGGQNQVHYQKLFTKPRSPPVSFPFWNHWGSLRSLLFPFLIPEGALLAYSRSSNAHAYLTYIWNLRVPIV